MVNLYSNPYARKRGTRHGNLTRWKQTAAAAAAAPPTVKQVAQRSSAVHPDLPGASAPVQQVLPRQLAWQPVDGLVTMVQYTLRPESVNDS